MLSAYLYELLFIVGAVISFASLILHYLYNKCPHCVKQLGRNEGAFCQYCGERIEN